jgi:hypothetical protein
MVEHPNSDRSGNDGERTGGNVYQTHVYVQQGLSIEEIGGEQRNVCPSHPNADTGVELIDRRIRGYTWIIALGSRVFSRHEFIVTAVEPILNVPVPVQARP